MSGELKATLVMLQPVRGDEAAALHVLGQLSMNSTAPPTTLGSVSR
jgi:hypothetical protein